MSLLVLLLALQEEPSQPDLELHPWSGFRAESSAFPSWLHATGRPRLLETVLEEGGAATLVLRSPDGEEQHALASGTGWFLNWADFPAAASLDDGTLAFAWLALEPEHEHSYGTRVCVADASLARRSEPRPLEEHRGPGEHGFVSLAPLDERRFLALWLDGRAALDPSGGHAGGETRVYARTLDRDGELGPETLVDPRACSCCPTSLVRLAGGGLLAAWRDRSDSEVRDIACARFDGHGWSEPALVHADGWKIDGCPVNGPRLAAAPDAVAATWYTGAHGGRVLVSLADAAARAFAGPIRVDDGAPVGRGDAVFLADGSLLVGWMEHGRPDSSWRVRRIRRDSVGPTAGPSLTICAIDSARASGFLRLAADGPGALLAYTETSPERTVILRRLVPLP